MTAPVGLVIPSTFDTVAARAAVALLPAAAATALLAVARRLPRRLLSHARECAWAALSTTLLVVLASGGARSVALPVLGLAVWGLVASKDWGDGAAGAAVSVLALGIHALRAHLPFVPAILGPGAIIGFTGFLPPWFGGRLVKVFEREGRLSKRIDAQLRTEAERISGATPRPRDLEISLDALEASLDQDRLVELLRDIRDATGADEAIWWRWIEQRNRLVPGAWSTEDATRPMFFRVQDWAPLVRWTGEERRVQLDGGGELPEFAATPLMTNDEFYGVLTLTSVVGLGLSREQARSWLPRYGRQVANLLETADLRRVYARQMRRNQNLLEAMKRLQEHKRAEALVPALCESVLSVSGGANAALVRWLPEEQRGVVQFSTEGVGVEAGAIVPEDSLVGGACRSGLKLVIEDARVASTAHSVYGGSGSQRPVPSMAVVPLKHDRRVIGAIVVEGTEPGAVTREDGQMLELLAGAVHGSLEIIWEIEEVNRRARTDALTGLWNRRHFDEHLKSEATRTDRSGSPCSLVLVDIDHFKQVNDTYGHEAGDAVLRQVAKVLSEAVRQMDICARYGGEEMAILLPQTGVAGAAEMAERVRAAIAARTMRYGQSSIQVTASFGVASFPETVAQGDGLFPAADKALYAAKSAGRNCVKVAPARAARSAP